MVKLENLSETIFGDFVPRKLKFFNIPMVVQIGLETTLVSALLPILTRGVTEVKLLYVSPQD